MALVGLDLPVSTAGVVLYRLSNYWFVVVLGALASVAFSIGLSDPPPVVPASDDPE